jgi:hypothetical protein
MQRLKAARACALLVSVALVTSTKGFAQSSNGYVVVGVGARESKATSQTAVGGEWVFFKGLGIGGELGVVAGHTSFGTVSINASYHIPLSVPPGKVDPFLSGGLTTALFGNGASGLANIAGGLHYWFHRRIGFRAEVRDFIYYPGDRSLHFWASRVGLAFR